MASLFPLDLLDSPLLPEFRTLLVKGNYHPSAPIHLAISSVLSRDGGKVVLMAPSRARLATRVKNDTWLVQHGGEGRVVCAAKNVDILYPPTPAHLTLLLSLFHEAMKTGKDFLHPKTTFSTTPSLIILCEPSAYFLESPEATVSSYLMLIAQALSTIQTLRQNSGGNTAFVLFDSGVDDLRLPVLSPLPMIIDTREENDVPPGPRREAVSSLLQRYFEWIGTVEDASDSSATPSERDHRLKLTRVGGHAQADADIAHEIE